MFLFLGFVLSNGSLTPLLYGVYGALLLFYLARHVNEVKAKTIVDGCLARLENENEKLNERLEFAEGERTKIIGFNRQLCDLFVTMKTERDNALNNCRLLERKNLQSENSSNFWLLHAAETEKELNNVKQKLMDERRENLSNSLYLNFFQRELHTCFQNFYDSEEVLVQIRGIFENGGNNNIIIPQNNQIHEICYLVNSYFEMTRARLLDN